MIKDLQSGSWSHINEYSSGIVHNYGWVNDVGCSTRRSMRWAGYFNGWTIDRHDPSKTVNNAIYPKEGTYGHTYARGLK